MADKLFKFSKTFNSSIFIPFVGTESILCTACFNKVTKSHFKSHNWILVHRYVLFCVSEFSKCERTVCKSSFYS